MERTLAQAPRLGSERADFRAPGGAAVTFFQAQQVGSLAQRATWRNHRPTSAFTSPDCHEGCMPLITSHSAMLRQAHHYPSH